MDASSTCDLVVTGGRCLLPDGGLAEADLTVAGGRIAEVRHAGAGWPAPAGAAVLDAAGLLVLPGIVDIHGDAFERQMMPRPGVHMPIELALQETDHQLVANGITTAYYGLTWSWEPGLRGADNARAFAAALARLKPRLMADTRLHLRWDTFNLDVVDEVCDWIAAGRVDLLAFNDHTLTIRDTLAGISNRGDKLPRYTARTGLSAEAFRALVEDVAGRADEVPAAVERLAGAARGAGVAQLSHDDVEPETRRRYHALGCTVAEFPLTRAAAAAAHDLGDDIVFGAPNVLRGGSHLPDGIDAAAMVADGICTVLASDYYYPSLRAAAFKLARDGRADFATAWDLVSRNAARAAGLDDRGELAPSKRADVVLVDDGDDTLPVVAAVLAGGRPTVFDGRRLRATS